MGRFVAEELPCLGSTLSFARRHELDEESDPRDVGVGIEDRESPAKATRRFETYS